MIVFDDVSLSFGRHELFKNISLNLRGGKVIGVTGANGAGKSTFLKLAGKIIRPDSGEVKLINDENNCALRIAHYALQFAAVAPEMKIYDNLTAQENLFFFAKLRGKTLSAEKISELGERVGLDLKTFGNVRAENFSTGMRQRLKFAILLSVDADIWLLDEPTANLDDDGREKFFREIQAAKPDKIILLATNDRAEENICDEIIKLPL
ncbi:MAG: ABC transporter ATP-binding protein [Selenomonadaceae bacterium]|nr:ABC transporter ATP-binding protein [Selenomonadaceae bacterium]